MNLSDPASALLSSRMDSHVNEELGIELLRVGAHN